MTEILTKLFIEIEAVKNKYDEIRDKNRFNVFTALNKEFDEVNLHSRFISYLLSPKSGHGMNESFCEIFVREILNLNKGQFDLQDFEVLPNEKTKSEYKEIDILIINKKTKQAIIIENKIFAKDSNRKKDTKKNDGYDGQLERYYNTIKKGIDKDGNEIHNFQCNTVFIYYLTMFESKQPSKESIGKLNNLPVIYYGNEIRNWLNECIQIIPDEKSLVAKTIQQYLSLVNKLTHNDMPIEERMELKKIIALNCSSTKYLIENFKHVKWHTVHDFWTTLKKALQKKYSNVSFFPIEFEMAITEVTHINADINIGVVFDVETNIKAYISGIGNLSWGILEPKKWTTFISENLENISFSDFATENTFRLIDGEYLASAVEAILNEISMAEKNNFNSLTKI